MHKIIDVTKLQRRLRAVLDQVTEENVSYVLTRDHKPEAALIPYEEYPRFQALAEQDVLACFDQLMARMAEQNAAVSDEQVTTDVVAARSERGA
jgi:prevent-host-death family protein